MPIANPYAKKKKAPSIPKPASRRSASSEGFSNVSVERSSETVQRTSQVKPSSSMITDNAPPTATPTVSTRSPPSVTAAIVSPVSSTVTRKSQTANISVQKTLPNKKSKKSFKSQLKNEIQELKRKKKLEMHRKLMEKRLKEQEAEKKRKEEERQRIRLENEKRKAEERRRKEEERERLRMERERLREAKAAERLAREQEKERQRQEKERIRIEREMAYHKRLMEWQERYMFNTNYMNLPAANSGHFVSNSRPMTYSHQQQVGHSFPLNNASSQSATNSGTLVGISTTVHQNPNPHIQPTLNNNFPIALNQDQSSMNIMNTIAPQAISAPFNSAPNPLLSLTPSMVPRHQTYQMPFSLPPHYWQRAPPPKRKRVQPSPLDQLLSFNLLEDPSPFASDFEILSEKIWIVKEKGGKFGVSVHVQCRKSMLLDPDVWQSLQIQAKATEVKAAPAAIPQNNVKKELIAEDTKAEFENDNLKPTDAKNTIIPVDADAVKILVQPRKSDTTQDPNGSIITQSDVLCSRAVTSNECLESKKSDVKGATTLKELESTSYPCQSEIKEKPPKIDESAGNATTFLPSSQKLSNCMAQNSLRSQPNFIKTESKGGEANESMSHNTRDPVDLSSIKSSEGQESTVVLNSNSTDKAFQVKEPTSINIVSTPETSQNNQQMNERLEEIPLKSSAEMNTPKVKKRRRKRASFYAMIVTDATKQNDMIPESNSKERLQPGDLLLEINGTKTAGLSYGAATQLFASCDTPKNEDRVLEEDLIKCSLVVARKKTNPEPVKVPIAKSPEKPLKAADPSHGARETDLKLETETKTPITGDLNVDELIELANAFAKTLTHSDRSLGLEVPKDIFEKCMAYGNLALRDRTTLQEEVNQIDASIEQTSAIDASTYWKNDREGNYSDIQLPDALKFTSLSLAQLSAIRALPRPLQGCRCGAVDHEYVNSQNCVLYHSLRKTNGLLENDFTQSQKMQKKSKELSALQNAFKDRIVKAKEEQENEKAEARFVDEMEKLQVSEKRQAVFSPNLITMVICAVAEVGPSFDKLFSRRREMSIEQNNNKSMRGDESKDIDNLPLSNLGKCETKHLSHIDEMKKETSGDNASLEFHPFFLAELLRYICRSWGHLYQEPSHSEYSWRWEVHHGQTSETMVGQEKSRNPRVPGTLTFENIQFVLNEKMMERLKKLSIEKPSIFNDDDDHGTEKKLWATDMLKVSLLLSHRKTGLFDELKALEQLGILKKTKFGGANLTKDWYTKVDPLVLNDMESKWSFEKDSSNKFLINSKVKRDLANYWVKVDGAWALNEDLGEIVFTDEEWDSWRRCFEDEIEKIANYEDGIGKFGI